MDRKTKYREENRELINKRAREKYAANKKEHQKRGKLKMKRYREKKVRELYPKYFECTEKHFIAELTKLKDIKKPTKEHVQKLSDMRLIQLIRGLKLKFYKWELYARKVDWYDTD